jgi:hypothetical protein
MRRGVTQAVLIELRKRTPRPDLRPVVGVIVRRVVHPDPALLGSSRPLPTPPNTPEEDALIAAAMAEFRQDGKVRRLILDSGSAACGA